MKKLVVFVVVVAMCFGLIAGCSTPAAEEAPAAATEEAAPAAEPAAEPEPAEEPAEAAPEEEPAEASGGDIDLSQYTIGMSMHFMMDDWAKAYVEAFEAKCQELGINYDIQDANNDAEKQLNDLTAFQSKGVDGIGILALDVGAIASICDEFAAEGVPVVPTADISDVCEIACFSDGGQWDKGNISGLELVQDLGGEGKIYIFTQPALSVTLDERIAGLEAAIEGTNIEIVETKLAADTEEAMNVMNDLLTSGAEVDAVWGSLGTMVLGAAEALKANDNKDVKVYGVDADYSILQQIKEGWVTAMAAQYPSATAENIINSIVRIWQGEELSGAVPEEKTREIINAGNVEERCMEIWNRPLE